MDRQELIECVLNDADVDPRIERALIELHPLLASDQVWIGRAQDLADRLRGEDGFVVVILVGEAPA